MHDRWSGFLNRLHCDGDPEVTFGRIEEGYRSPPRAYHNLNHIAHGLDELSLARHLCVEPDVVEMAFWLHDIVYDPHAHDNEERSAVFAYQLCDELRLPSVFRNNAAELILASKHETIATSPDAMIFADLDLAIFGSSPDRFDEYEQLIREEYSFVPLFFFKRERTKILKSFLERPRIYASDYFQDIYGAQAKKNLERSIARLRA